MQSSPAFLMPHDHQQQRYFRIHNTFVIHSPVTSIFTVINLMISIHLETDIIVLFYHIQLSSFAGTMKIYTGSIPPEYPKFIVTIYGILSFANAILQTSAFLIISSIAVISVIYLSFLLISCFFAYYKKITKKVKNFVNFASTLIKCLIINKNQMIWEKVIKNQEEVKLYLELLV